MSDYYQDLGVERSATAEEIKRAYRRLARQLHPDVNSGAEAEEQFKTVSRAYEVLSDPDKRRNYDLGVDPFAAGGGRWLQRAGLLVQRRHGRLLRGRGHPARPALAGAPRPGRARPDPDRPAGRGLRLRGGAHHRDRRPMLVLPGGRLPAGDRRVDLRPVPRPRRGADGAAVLPRAGDDDSALPGLPGLRLDDQPPVFRVLGRGSGPHPAHPHPQGSGRGRLGHPHPTGRRRRGRHRRRLGGRPVCRGRRGEPRHLHAAGGRPALPGRVADDGRGPGDDDRPADLRRHPPLRRAARHPGGRHDDAAWPWGDPPARHRPRRPHRPCRRPDSDPAHRGPAGPVASVGPVAWRGTSDRADGACRQGPARQVARRLQERLTTNSQRSTPDEAGMP
ncbi:MAG: DnaJ domain-containing protein [Actinomycetales bacterium]|uniref:DnaJ domain-containing protein n=1 Tax=Candidatus Phosphoribacter hodrii TaxID=2953743 RepID=A0A9D7XYC4_9MICO|nr:DnaJ domain-containing protein [Candidatus Phosphoribacter hodrii]